MATNKKSNGKKKEQRRFEYMSTRSIYELIDQIDLELEKYGECEIKYTELRAELKEELSHRTWF